MVTFLRRREGRFDVLLKNDGIDYWRLAKACIDLHLDQAALMRGSDAPQSIPLGPDGVDGILTVLVCVNPKRLVLRLGAGDKRYVVKRAFMHTFGFKRILPWFTGLTYFTNIMKQVDDAVRAGCDATQEYYLVAERRIGFFRQEVWVVMEYLEGEMVPVGEAFAPHRAAMRDAAVRLLDHGLTMNDLSLGNFLLCPDGRVRAIDISCRPCVWLQKAKMAVKLNTLYGLDIPVSGWWRRMLYTLLKWRNR